MMLRVLIFFLFVGISAGFPATSFVQLRDGSRKLMRDVVVGDVVRTGPSAYEPIKNWLVYNPDMSDVEMIRITGSDMDKLYFIMASADQYVHTRRGLIKMSNVNIEDSFWNASGQTVHVIKKEHIVVSTPGLYVPYTKSGNIVVNDIMSSIYAMMFPSAHGRDALDYFMGIRIESCVTSDGMHCAPWLFLKVHEYIMSFVG